MCVCCVLFLNSSPPPERLQRMLLKVDAAEVLVDQYVISTFNVAATQIISINMFWILLNPTHSETISNISFES